MTTIGTEAFTLTSIESIDVPASVTQLDLWAFEGMNNLEYLWFDGDAPQVNIAFLDDGVENYITVCYHSSKSGWTEAKSSWSMNYGATWYDIDSAVSAADFSISGASLKVGSEKSLTTNADSVILDRLTWTSSNKNIAIVGGDGLVTGLRAGTVTITAASADGVYKSRCTVTVKAKSSGTLLTSKKVSKATVSDNVSENDYYTWSDTVNSYLIANDDGTYTRLENISGTKLTVETWSASGKCKSKKTIKGCLTEFGGFYYGEKYNFLVYGRNNSKCSNKKVVIRIVKYSKNWKKLGTVNVKNVDTTIPFRAGSLRMTEVNGKLYVYTGHRMYSGHQSNMMLIVNESAMSYTTTSRTYVSHSFNQFILTDGESVYTLDHGDGYPRAVVIHKMNPETYFVDAERSVLEIWGKTGDNATGVSVGGFALSSDYCQPVVNASGQVVWYTSEQNKVTMYKVNPYRLLTAKNQSLKIKKSSLKKKVSAKKLKKSAQTFKVKATAKGKVTFRKTFGSDALRITKNGKVKVRKGTSSGTYYMQVKIKAAKKGKYPSRTVTKYIRVTVK